MGKQNQIQIIQSLRGISAMGVVLFAHLWHNSANIVIHPMLNELSQAGAYGVQVFFIISGFILPYSLRNKNYSVKKFFKFMWKRLVRLEPAYLGSIALTLLFTMVIAPNTIPNAQPAQMSVRDLWLHLLYLVPFVRGANWVQGVNWTLAIEFQYYILLGIVAPLLFGKQTHKSVKHLILLFFSFSGLLLSSQVFAPRWLTFFCIGICLYLIIYENFSIKDYILQLIVAMILNWIYFESIYFLIILCIIPAIITIFLKKQNLPFLFLGKISYSIYLIHGFLGIYLYRLTRYYLPEPSVIEQILLLSGITLICILFSWLYYEIFEKTFQKLSKKISY